MRSPVLLLRPLTLSCAIRPYVFICSNNNVRVMYLRESLIQRASEVEFGQFTTETWWKCTRNYKPIQETSKHSEYPQKEEAGAENIVKEIKQYREKWQHVQRMDKNRIPKQALQYKPKGRRHIGRPRKRWRDQFYFEDTRNRNQT
jgi:hypothetical protein